jgi:hypothetical protein
MEWVMSRLDAERLARLHDGFYAEQDQPRFLNSPRLEDGPDRTSPLEAVAGFAVVALVFVLIFWGL